MADFPTLKEKITILQTLDMLGITLNKESRTSCPLCGEGGNRIFKAFVNTNTFYCWSCKKSGTIIDLVMGVLKCDEPAAGRKLAEAFDIKSPPRKPEPTGKFDAEKWGKDLDPDAEQLKIFGISPTTYRAFGAGYNGSKPSLKGMLCIPVRDAGGPPLGFVGVALDTQELSFPKGVSPDMLLNADRITPGTLHVVSHPLDVLRQIETGIEELANVVAIMTAITPDMLDGLTAIARERGVESFEFHA
jgi:hypothetical protein